MHFILKKAFSESVKSFDKNLQKNVSLLIINNLNHHFQLQKRDFSFASNIDRSKPIPTMHQIRSGLMDLIGYDVTWGNVPIDKSSLKHENDKAKLIPEKMATSYAEAVIPLGDQPLLRNRYTNFQNLVRFGRLLEDLDTMAVHISYLHNKNQCVEYNGHLISPIVIVTALVDRIEILNNKMNPEKNIKLSGFTSWVGSSSSEITMKVEQEISNGVWGVILEAKFLVCARDTKNVGSALMTPLEPTTDEEKAIFKLGEANKKLRQKEVQNSLFNLPPNNTESLIIHELYKKTIDLSSGSLKTRIKPQNSEWMNDTKLKNVLICFPEQRNLYNKIFGGFIMRQAYELAWSNACLFSKTVPRTCVVDNISFRRPVLIGSLLLMSSQIVYTKDNFMQIKVHAETIDPKTNLRETTNDFYFKFSVPPNLELKAVMPKSYSEAMMYIDGIRHM